MKAPTIAGLATTLLITGIALAQAPITAILPQQIRWIDVPAMPGVKIAWLVGEEKAAGSYAQRVRLASGARIPVHTHPDTRYSTVLSGTLHVGFGSKADDAKLVAIPAGSVYIAPANTPHFLWARDGEVIYQEGGIGPTATVILAP